MTVWLWFSFGELLRPVTFSDEYFFITFLISCIQCWLVEGFLSPAGFHPSLVPRLGLTMCCVEGKDFLEVKTGSVYVLLMQKCWPYHVILHSALVVFWTVHISNFIWKATVVQRISLSKAILHYILWCNSSQCSQEFWRVPQQCLLRLNNLIPIVFLKEYCNISLFIQTFLRSVWSFWC